MAGYVNVRAKEAAVRFSSRDLREVAEIAVLWPEVSRRGFRRPLTKRRLRSSSSLPTIAIMLPLLAGSFDL
jgi:hypothetical protein